MEEHICNSTCTDPLTNSNIRRDNVAVHPATVVIVTVADIEIVAIVTAVNFHSSSIIIVLVRTINAIPLTFITERIRRIKPRLASVGAYPGYLVTHIAMRTVPTR